jgi:hypothetical protein
MDATSERELEENIRFMDTFETARHLDDIDSIVRIVWEHFKFGYAGYNGWIKDYNELREDLKPYIKS